MTRPPYRCAVGLMIKTDEVSEQGCTVQQIAKLKDVTERTVYNALEIKRLTSGPQKK
jgi:hypothetical protein